jgi:hypothetical protein
MSFNESFLIIGGGFTGLYLAYKLCEEGYTNITILEQKSYLGGSLNNEDKLNNIELPLKKIEYINNNHVNIKKFITNIEKDIIEFDKDKLPLTQGIKFIYNQPEKYMNLYSLLYKVSPTAENNLSTIICNTFPDEFNNYKNLLVDNTILYEKYKDVHTYLFDDIIPHTYIVELVNYYRVVNYLKDYLMKKKVDIKYNCKVSEIKEQFEEGKIKYLITDICGTKYKRYNVISTINNKNLNEINKPFQNIKVPSCEIMNIYATYKYNNNDDYNVDVLDNPLGKMYDLSRIHQYNDNGLLLFQTNNTQFWKELKCKKKILSQVQNLMQNKYEIKEIKINTYNEFGSINEELNNPSKKLYLINSYFTHYKSTREGSTIAVNNFINKVIHSNG